MIHAHAEAARVQTVLVDVKSLLKSEQRFYEYLKC